MSYLESAYKITPNGTLTVECADIQSYKARVLFGSIVFSPPYANRLDYLRMFAPEAVVLRQVAGVDILGLSRFLIGTNVVSKNLPDDREVRQLPKSARDALVAIRDDPAKASASYYYPFFANYAIGLYRAVTRIGEVLAPKGTGLAFLRDTPRKDVLFPSAEIVAAALRTSGCRVVASAEVVRRHIGMRRKRTHTSLQGLAQREWTLRFVKAR
jgi:hypothetical protein